MLYSIWVSQFIGEVGRNTSFCRPLLLQGGGSKRIRIGSNTHFEHHCVLGCWEQYFEDEHYEPEIFIGENCSIGEYCHITAINKITIGNGLLTGRFVYIGDNAHGRLSLEEAAIPPARRHLITKGEIQIGDNVWIGDKVSIFGGVTIGDNVIIGAGSIVTHDLPNNCMAAGAPAKIVKQL
jgi:acetyltransferase-like isoleucine patch superfamily enzyme